MSEKKIIIGDDMVETQLKENSKRLNLSLDGLIERYIRRGLFMDDYYVPPQRTREQLMEIAKKEREKDRKRGIPPKKHNFDVFVGRWNKSSD